MEESIEQVGRGQKKISSNGYGNRVSQMMENNETLNGVERGQF